MLLSRLLECFSHWFTKWVGSASGFCVALLSIIIWLTAGWIFEFSHHWETGIMIYIGVITFLIVFLIQRSQNKELAILHVKLDELIASTNLADNRLMNIEDLTEKEISKVQDMHRRIGGDE